MVYTKEIVFVSAIEQVDDYCFSIVWSDGKKNVYRLSDLQRHCPCAACCDDQTGQRRQSAPPVDQNVKAKKIISVGRYALSIQFVSGCSMGIFDFSYLRQIAEDAHD